MGLVGILLGLGLLLGFSFRGWSVLVLAPAAALLAAAFAGEPLLAHWTQTFMSGAAHFMAQFFPIFLLGALFGKLMDDSGSVSAIAQYMTRKLGQQRAILAIVLAGAFVTYGGVSLMVAFFVLVPMAQALFRVAAVPLRLMPATIVLGTSTFTMSALPGTPAVQNAIPMPFFGTTPFAAPGLGVVASAIMLGWGLWWLTRAEAAARRRGEGYNGPAVAIDAVLGKLYMNLAAQIGIDPALMHRVAVIGSGTLDTLPHNGAVVTLLALCGCTHRESYFDIIIAGIVGPIIALCAVIALGSGAGSF
jgi:H+/gluconate symporter-like permease